MSFWDDIKSVGDALVPDAVQDTAKDVGRWTWEHTKGQVSSLTKAGIAPIGLVYDLAAMPFDDKDDDFSTLVDKLSRRGGDIIDPLLGDSSISGVAVQKTMEGLNWVYEEAVDQPLATAANMASAAMYELNEGGLSSALDTLVTPENWARAYQVADDMSIGESMQVGTYNTAAAIAGVFTDTEGIDTLNDAETNPYDRMHAEYAQSDTLLGDILGKTASAGKWGTDIGTMFAGDPAAAALKGVGAARQVGNLRKLSTTEKANSARVMVSGEDTRTVTQKALGAKTVKSRTEELFDYLDGANPMQRPLTSKEISLIPEIRQYSSQPAKISGLLGDAAKIEDKALRHDSYRTVLAVAAGDPNAVRHLASQRIGKTDEILDKLESVVKGRTVNLERVADDPLFKYRPEFIKELQVKVGRLNSRGDVDKFVDDFNARIDDILGEGATEPGIVGSLKNLPGVHAKANRAIRRENEITVPRKIDKVIDEAAQRAAAKRQATSGVFQKGLHTVPIIAIKSAKFLDDLYTKPFTSGVDALRNTHFTGMASVHNWGAANQQIEAALRLGRVAGEERSAILAKSMTAKTEQEKVAVVHAAERAALKGLASHYSKKFGGDLDESFIEALMFEYAGAKSLGTSSLRGRAFAATKSSEDVLEGQMATREATIARAEEAAAAGSSRKNFSVTADDSANWRVDHFMDETGTAVSMPVLETQVANYIPIVDMNLANKLMRRDFTHLARASKAWRNQAEEVRRLESLKADAKAHRLEHRADQIDNLIAFRRQGMDAVVNTGQRLNRLWKFSVLFRLGYPLRVLTDDHLRIISQVGAVGFYGANSKEGAQNAAYNWVGRKREAKKVWGERHQQRRLLKDQLDTDEMRAYPERLTAYQKAAKTASGRRGYLTKLQNQGVEGETLDRARRLADEADAEAAYFQNKLGDTSPDDLQKSIDELTEEINKGWRAFLPDKKSVGSRDVVVDGVNFGSAFDDVHRRLASSNDTFDAQLNRIEETMYKNISTGDFKTYNPTDTGHLAVWEDVLNHQVAKSKVARFFLKGGTAEDFAQWIQRPEQALLRKRVPHFARDPEDWGSRVEQMIHDYVPTEELRDLLLKKGSITRKDLSKRFDIDNRPAVHGELMAQNLGEDAATGMFTRGINRMYRWLGELPTDRLSRHPYFATMFEHHVKESVALLKAAKTADGKPLKFTKADHEDIIRRARRDALNDVRTTLFDISAHSNAAHTMRFISPFFAAHQEALQRWWRIASDNPQVLRRAQQAFDLPRHAGLVVDENGDPVKPGEGISGNHSLIVPSWMVPGGSDWEINEQSFNIIMPGGLTNPGAGPLVSVPFDYLANKYADSPSMARVANMFNPYPQESALASVFPATMRRALAVSHAKGGPDIFGVGEAEFNTNMTRAANDLMVDFQRKYHREPTSEEMDQLLEDAKNEAFVTASLRVLWNATSPLPPRPTSRYAAIQDGWYKISAQAKSEGKDFDWARARFKEKYGEAYLALTSSGSKNPAGLDGTALDVEATKKYGPLLEVVDPSLQRMIRGPFEEEMLEGMSEEERKAWTERTLTARRYFEGKSIDGIGDETYFSKSDPATAMQEAQARRGWARVDEITSALTNIAVQNGLSSYLDSPQLKDLRKRAIQEIMDENDSFARDYQNRDAGRFDAMLIDMGKIATNKTLLSDPGRTDIHTLQKYLQLREAMVGIFKQRQEQGYGGPTAQANSQLRLLYTQAVGELVESNTFFSEFMFNGTIEFDPLLAD